MRVDLARLASFDTPTISNAIELFEVRPRNEGYMDGRIRACFPDMAPVVGYASTASMRCAFARREGDVYASLDEQVARFEELPGPAMVVYQDLDDPAVGATFGEIMCTTYKAFGAAGLITSGPARDLEQVRRLGFAAFSNGALCSHGYSHIVDLHRTVRVGGLAISPGDLLHADCNGVVKIPLEIANEVADAAGELVRAEAIVLEYLAGGKVDAAGMRRARAEMMAELGALGKRLRV
ncbi:MAG TPA: RraA family protein [Candidatus Limnocylindrales bacterium]|nr:RraA family protein [Candidatus Limnocylindrales bacterium]